MNSKLANNTVDSAVPKSQAAKALSDNEKKALELGEQAEHQDGPQREQLQKKAANAAQKSP